ncbi:hypothetical protein LCGC14_0988480 [marine sediment metagenome]|uniref:Flagellar assembly protein T C-terminal domain-containing protein n=1 Tax=marine sediment metagenome TaxID=412755 RepID=A0A0F9NB47_9ZZZZ
MLKKRKWIAGLTVVFALFLGASFFLEIANAAEKKIRIAVMPLDMRQIKHWWTWDLDVGEGIGEIIITELVNTGAFTVIERAQLQKILDEQQLGKEGILDPTTAARVGKVLGVQLILLGTVTEFSLDAQKVSVPILGKVDITIARCVINAKMVNVETAEIMAAMKREGQFDRKGFALGRAFGSLQGLSFNSREFHDHILGQATEAAAKGIVEEVVEKTADLEPILVPEPAKITGMVADVSDGEITINVGSKKGVEVGDIFEVYRKIKEIKDPETGEVIMVKKEKIAEIEITEVVGSASVAKIVLLAQDKEIQVLDEVVKQKRS